MKKGVVMESNGKWTVILTPEGEFMKIPSHPHHLEGKEVSFRVSLASAMPKKKKPWTPTLMRGVALTAACLLFLVMVFPFFGGSQAYAAVTFDINPSLELEVDEQAKIIEATPFNEEAQKLLDTVQWKGQSLSDVALEIIEQAEAMGYMNAERQVLITATYLEEEQEKENITEILEAATSQADQELTVVIVEGSKEWHEEAKQKQVPPGAYMLVKQAEEQGIELKEKEWQANQIEEMPPVKGVRIIHPKGSKKDKEEDLNKAKEEKKENKKEEKKEDKKKELEIKQHGKDQTLKNKDKTREEIKDPNKDDKKVKNNDQDNDDRDKGRETEKDDRDKAENEQGKNERSDQNQKQSKNEKGPSGPPSHVKKDSSSKPKKDDDQKKKSGKEKDDDDRDNKRNEKERK